MGVGGAGDDEAGDDGDRAATWDTSASADHFSSRGRWWSWRYKSNPAWTAQCELTRRSRRRRATDGLRYVGALGP